AVAGVGRRRRVGLGLACLGAQAPPRRRGAPVTAALTTRRSVRERVVVVAKRPLWRPQPRSRGFGPACASAEALRPRDTPAANQGTEPEVDRAANRAVQGRGRGGRQR